MPSLTPQYQSRCVRLLTALLLLCPIPICLYGPRAALLLAIGLVCAFLCDLIFRPLFGLERKKRDLSSYITALLITLLLPAGISWYGVICGVVFGLLIGKYLFGGTGRNIFNPAALGVAVVSLAFGDSALSYPAVGQSLGLEPVLDAAGVVHATSPAAVLTLGGTPSVSYTDLLLGSYSGAMGVTCIAALVVIGVALCLLKTIPWRTTVSAVAAVLAFAALFPRVPAGILPSMIYELSSGVLLFGILFLASDPVSGPNNPWGQVFYGVAVAVGVMCFRYVGALETDICFVLLLASPLSKEFDRLGGRLSHLIARRTGRKKEAESC